jgi:hypothetical protein
MSAQAEEVVAAAESLAQMARQLDSLVGRFHLDGGGVTGRSGAVPAMLGSRQAGTRARKAA